MVTIFIIMDFVYTTWYAEIQIMPHGKVTHKKNQIAHKGGLVWPFNKHLIKYLLCSKHCSAISYKHVHYQGVSKTPWWQASGCLITVFSEPRLSNWLINWDCSRVGDQLILAEWMNE